MNNRKFIITHGVTDTEVFPVYETLKYKWEKNDNELNFTKSLETKLLFNNNSKKGITDFTFFSNLESDINTRCSDIFIEIFRLCSGSYVSEFKGIVRLVDGEWDYDRCTVVLEITGNNQIDCINNNKTIADNPLAFYTFKNPTVGCPTDLGIYDYNSGSSSFEFLDVVSLTAPTYPNYIKKPYISDNLYPYGTFYNLCRNIVKELLVKCGRDEELPMIRSDFFDWNAIGDTPGYVASSLPVLPESEPRPASTKKEWFLPKTPGTNYVTGQTNRLTHLMFMPKSNARNSSSSIWETGIGDDGFLNDNRITFEELENIWSTMFHAYWFIDTDGCMRIEHESWFNSNSSEIDVTTGENEPLNRANNKYNYETSELVEKEIFSFGFNGNILNGGKTLNELNPSSSEYNIIKYHGNCIKKGLEKRYEVIKVDTDMYILDSAGHATQDNYSNSGIFLCSIGTYDTETYQCTTGGYVVNSINCVMHFLLLSTLSGTHVINVNDGFYFNAHLNWFFLIRDYHRGRRVLSEGTNGQNDAYTLTFNPTTIKTKSQKNVRLISCCEDIEFDANKTVIKTELGVGEIYEAEYDTKTNIFKIILRHD